MRGALIDLAIGLNGRQRITVEIPGDFREEYERLKGGDVSVEIKKYRKGRSLDANSYCWVICQKIGNAITPPIPKEDVYRQAIRDVGVFEPLPIKNDAVESFNRRWGSQGIGWFVDVIDDAKFEGYKRVFAYYGSSTYDTKEMSILIDHLVSEAKELDIVTDTPEQIARYKDEWGRTR